MKKIKKLYREMLDTINFYSVFIVAFIVSAALFVIDYYDWVSKIVMPIPVPIIIVLSISVVAVVFVLVIKYSLFDSLKLKMFTSIDGGFIAGTFIMLLYLLSYFIILRDREYKWKLGLAILVSEIVIVFIRLYIVSKAHSDAVNVPVTLQDLLDGKVSKDKLPIVVSEKVDTTDLLERDVVVNNLYRAITSNHNDRCYTIGLEGSWGAGKTTVIEITKEKLSSHCDIIIIDDFDPWLYKSQGALLTAAYESILQKLNIKYNPRKIQNAIQSVQNIISAKYSIFDSVVDLFVGGSHSETFGEIRNQVEKFLLRENKTVLFIMDNFDRSSTGTVLSIFKFIGLMLNCPGIIYLLSYDKSKLDKDFERQSDFDERFYEKIIDQEIKLPDVSNDRRRSVLDKCMTNLLNLYEEKPNMDEYREIYNFLVNSKIDIRQLKRYVNTVFPFVFIDETPLCKKDLLTITTIQFFSPNLYAEISANRKYFISSDIIHFDPHQAFRSNREEFEKECKQYYSDLEKQYPGYTSLLHSIFPSMGILGFSQDSRFDSESYQSISRNCNICSGKYFDLYFCCGSNYFTVIKGVVEKYLARLETSSTFQEDTKITVLTLPTESHKEFAERLQLYINTIEVSLYGKLAMALYESAFRFDSSAEFLALHARDRIVYVIAILLMKCTQPDFNAFLEEARVRFDRLGVLQRIYHDIKEEKNNELPERVQAVLDIYRAACQAVISQEIDIYSDEYYHDWNAWSVIESELPVDIDGVDSYVQTLIKPQNVYRILWDCVSKSVGSHGYGYSISEKLFSRFFTETEMVDCLIEKNLPKNESESKVFEIYEMYKNPRSKSFEEEKDLVVSEELHITL